MLKANDYGKILTLESCRKIKVDDLVRDARVELKKHHLESISLQTGHTIDFTTSRTRFGGKRYWFRCPGCQSRVGVLYQDVSGLSCRLCVGYRYKGSRYNGMS